MAYLPNIPQPTDQLSVSQPNILNNFQALSPFGSSCALLNPITSPGTASDQIAIFSAISSLASADQQLFIRRPSDGTITEFTNSTMGLNGGTELPSGIILRWGLQSSITGSATINFPTLDGVANFAAIYIYLAYARSNSTDIYVTVTNASATGLSVNVTQRTTNTPLTSDVQYFCVGI